MKWKNNEMSVFLRDDNIIIIKVDKEIKKLTVPAAQECAIQIKEVLKLNEKPNVLLFYVPDIYISKNVIRCYADTVFEEAGIAVYCETFTAWLMGNIAVTIRKRFMTSNPATGAPVKAFKKEEEAIEWSLGIINEAS